MTRKAPIRTCVACGEKAPKESLIRVVKSPEGKVNLDPRGTAAGRGAYVCRKRKCFDKACSKHLLNGKLRTRLTAGDYDSLIEDFDALCLDDRAM